MTEQTKRLRKSLEGCAERGISPTPEPWAEIEARLRDHGATRTHLRRFVPRTRTGMALAAVLVVLSGMGTYAASGPVYDQFRLMLPGARAPIYGEQLGLVQTAHGVRVSLEWAYADSRNVVVGYNIEDLEGDRRVNGRPTEIGAVGDGLTDESGTDFDGTAGQSSTTGNLEPLTEVPTVGVFAPEKAIEPGSHKFRIEIPVVARELPRTKVNRSEPVGEPFVFDFEIPVRPAPTIEVDRAVEANGVTLTLERVVDSPARPQAVFCLNPPVDGYYWSPVDESPMDDGLVYEGGPVAGEGYCEERLLADALEGRSSLTVTKLEGSPRDRNSIDYRTIRGPWTFEFTVPER